MANEVIKIWRHRFRSTPGSTLTVALYMYAKERGEFDTAFAIAVILILLTLVLNIAAKLAAKKMRKER